MMMKERKREGDELQRSARMNEKNELSLKREDHDEPNGEACLRVKNICFFWVY